MATATSDQHILQQEREKLHVMLLSSVSHDLKTPLSCIIGSLEIHQQLKATLSADHKDTLINTAIEEARRLDSFITNIIDMSKLESGIAFKREPVSIASLAEQCVLQLEPHMNGRKIGLELLSQVTAEVNAAWISRAITLLLDNALRYTPEEAEITVSVSGDNCAFWIAVRDSGPGISSKLQSGIFQKHTRAERQDSKIAGTGLGLPICKAIIEAHGGSIRMESSSAGTVFTLALPVTRTHLKQKKAPV